MSGLGVALSSMVNGFVDGRNVRHAWDDRKDEKVRKKRRDELLETAEKRTQESHDMSITSSGLMNDARRQSLRLGDRQWDDDQRLRAAWDADLGAAESGMPPMGAAPAAAPGPSLIDTPTAATPMPDVVSSPAGRPALSFGRPAGQPSPAPAASGGLSFGPMGAAASGAAGPVRAGEAPAVQSVPAQMPPLGGADPALAPPLGAAVPAQTAAQAAPAPAATGAPSEDALFVDAGNGKVMTARPPRTPEETRQIALAAKEKRLVVSPDRQAAQQRIDRQHVAPAQTYSMEDWRRMSRAERQAADLPVSEIGGQMYFDRFSVGMGAEPPRKAGSAEEAAAEAWTAARQAAIPDPDQTGLQRDIRRVGQGTKAVGNAVGNFALRGVEGALNTPGRLFDGTVRPAMNAAVEYVAGPQEGMNSRTPQIGDLNRDGKEETLLSPVLDWFRPDAETPEAAKAALDAETAKPKGKGGKTATEGEAAAAAVPPQALGATPGRPMTKAALAAEATKAPGEKALAQGASAAMDALGDTPDMKAAADAVTPAALGATPGRPMTAQQVNKGATTLIDSWRKTGAPSVTRELLRQGRIEEARALDTFIKSADAQDGMKLWAKGMFQAQMGDMVGAFDTWIEGYNAAGYYDDGYSVIKDKSRIIPNDAGQPVGVDLVFRNEATGEVFNRAMSPEDMGQTFGLILSPVEAFAASQARQKSLAEALVKQQEADAKTGRDLIVEDYKANRAAQDKAAQHLFEQGNDLLNKDSGGMSLQDARARALGAAPVLPEDELPLYR